MADATRTGATPDCDEAIPDSYAIRVDENRVSVWQYRVDVENPNGSWRFVETHDVEDNLRLSLDLATPTPPTGEGYWIYSRTYDCQVECA